MRSVLTCMVVVSSSLACPMMLCFTGRLPWASARYSRKSGNPANRQIINLVYFELLSLNFKASGFLNIAGSDAKLVPGNVY